MQSNAKLSFSQYKKIKDDLKKLHQYFHYYQATKKLCKGHYQSYLILCLDFRNKEEEMVEHFYLQFIINDILATGEYTLEGIAHQTRISIDALTDILTGINKLPSYQTVFHLLELHYAVSTIENAQTVLFQEGRANNESSLQKTSS